MGRVTCPFLGVFVVSNIRVMSKKEIINAGIILSVFSVIYILFLIPTAHAASIKDSVNEMVDFITEGASQNIYGLFADTYTHEALTFGTDFMTICKGLAAAFAVALMVGKIEESLARGKGDSDSLGEGVIALCICMLFVLHVDDLIDLVNKIGQFILASMATNISSDIDPNKTTAYKKANDTMEAIGLAFKIFLPYILAKIETIAVKMVAFSLIIELGIRRIFFPLAIVDIYGEGMRSPGMRYIKKYLACWLRMAICIAVAYLGTQMIMTATPDDSSGVVDTFINNIAIGYTTIAVMLKGSDIANDIVGA